MSRGRAIAVLLIVLLLIGHLAAYQYLAAYVTEQVRDNLTGDDRALPARSFILLALTGDWLLASFLIFRVGTWKRRMDELAHVRGELADVRKALEMERALTASDERMHRLVETAGMAIFLLDGSGHLALANRHAADALGLMRHQVPGTSLADLLAPQAKVNLADLQRALIDEGPQSITLPLRRRDGGVINMYVQLTLFEGMNSEHWISAFCQPLDEMAELTRPDATKTPDFVLVADDEELIRLLAKNMLLRMGYQPLLAVDGAEAVKLFERHAPRIKALVLDVIMPNLNGRETYDRIREIDRTVPVIFCSGLADYYDLGHFDEEVLLLQKPFSLDQFEEAITNAIAKETY